MGYILNNLMQQYELYSFDVWDTLIKSNPKFSIERAPAINKIFESYAYDIFTIAEINNAFREVKKMHDQIILMSSRCISAEQLISIALIKLGFQSNAHADLIEDIHAKVNELFLENLPIVHDDVYTVLDNLNAKNRILTVLCNTGFIPGDTLLEAFKRLNLDKYFNDFHFSDEGALWAKPSLEFFKYNLEYSIPVENILHVGDNKYTDGGAKKYGMNFYQVHSNSNKLIDLIS